MEKEKFNSLINAINKISRLNILQYKIEKIVEEYDEFIEDFYFIEWLRLSTNNYTEKEELNNTLELFEELLEEIEIAIFNAKDKLNNICISLLTYNKKDIEKIIKNIEKYSNEYIINLILDFAENNFYEIDAQYLVLELEKLFQGGLVDDKTRM
jgi:guanylate kinase